MGHDRKPHTRRYPIRADGTRRPGRVNVNGAHVNDSDGDGGAACGCCLVVVIAIGYAVHACYTWIVNLFS